MDKAKNTEKCGLASGVFILILSILFAAVVYVWITSFGGEFLIIARYSWILLTFAALLAAFSIYGLIRRVMGKEPHHMPVYIRVIFTIWNPAAGVILLFLFSKLFMWVVDTMSLPELLALSLPFIGFGILLILDGVIVTISLLKSRTISRGIPGAVLSGTAFLFVFGAFALALMFWSPSYAPGIEHSWLFKKGMQEGRGYRIPSMLAMKDASGRDVVLAFAESRQDAMFDWGDIDLVMRRSIDGGRTWGPVQVLVDAGKRTAGNPCPVFDRDTKTLWLPYCIDNKQVWMMKSEDFGKTFSSPVEITDELDLDLKCNDSPLCMEYGTGPGIGIQLENSRLIIPAYYFGPSKKRGAHVVFSDDHGKTWRKGKDIGTGQEPQAIQRIDGTLYMNCRHKRCLPRQIGLSGDGGQTWMKHHPDNELIDAETQASIISLPGRPGRVLFSNPAGCARGNMTVRLSSDDAATWLLKKEIFSGPSCYSQLCALPDGDVLLLFEAGKYDYREGIVLVRLALDNLADSEQQKEGVTH